MTATLVVKTGFECIGIAIKSGFECLGMILDGICTSIGLLVWRSLGGLYALTMAMLHGAEVLIDNRVVAMGAWLCYFGIQDVLKDPDVQTLILSPATIDTWSKSTYLFIGFKASIPMLGGFITYKSKSWAEKGGQLTLPEPTPPPTKP